MPGDSGSPLEPAATVAVSLEGSGWVPIRELGRGGGGVVLLCAREQTVAAIDRYARSLPPSRRDQPSSASTMVRDVPENRDRLEDVLDSARAHDGIAAVKVPHVTTTDPGEEERFRREVDATEQYVHPALIRFIDRDRRNPPRWFAMEYHARGNLSEPENRAKYLGDPLTVLADMRPVAEAIRLVHHGGAVHRDVKPKNIFIADRGQLVLGDFGIVVPAPEATRLTAIEPAHSRDWVPDWVQFGEERRYTTAVDVFALAKVMYYLLAGENVMASQLYREIDVLRARHSDARGIVPMLALLEKCIVDREDKCVVTNGAALLKEIDSILTAEATLSPRHLLFSWSSTVAATDVPLPAFDDRGAAEAVPAIAGATRVPRLSGIPIFLGRPADRMVGRVRLRGSSAMIQVSVGLATSDPIQLAARAATSNAAGEESWTDEFVLRATTPLPPGWHELSVHARCYGDASISGLMLYSG